MSQSDIPTRVDTRTVTGLKEPVMYRVIYINDDKTTQEFVIESLVEYFNYNVTTAERITTDIHADGAAVVAVLPYEIAEQKGIEITFSARRSGFPLQIKLEPDAS